MSIISERHHSACLGIFLLLGSFSVIYSNNPADGETVIATEIIEDAFVYVTPKPSGAVHLAESFDDLGSYKSRWLISSAKKDDTDESIAKYNGEWALEAALESGLKGDLGLVLKSKAKHHAISARLNKPYVFDKKPLIVQYEVNFQNGQDCGGAYIKLLTDGKDLNLKNFRDKTPYTIMFGPDKCGNDVKLHFIFQHRNPINGTLSEKHCKRPTGKIEDFFKDKKPHLYTLVINPDNSFQILVDNTVVNEGSLLEDFTPAVNPPEEIDDPEDKKPKDWDEREKIPDPNAKKPEDWDEDAPRQISDPSAKKPDDWLDDEPESIPDPNALKPEDWDDEMDGEWEPPLISNPNCEKVGCGDWNAPLIDNPNHKGKWYPPTVDNPHYQGKWKARRIPNPDFFEDKHPFKMASIGAIGLELWSMSDGIYFDNIVITNNKLVADQWAKESFEIKRMKGEQDAEGLIPRLLKYTNSHPWLWAVYVVVIGLPVVLIFVFCCSSSEEKKQQKKAAKAKKLDLSSPDDEPQTVEEAADEIVEDDKTGGVDDKASGDTLVESENKESVEAGEEEEENDEDDNKEEEEEEEEEEDDDDDNNDEDKPSKEEEAKEEEDKHNVEEKSGGEPSGTPGRSPRRRKARKD